MDALKEDRIVAIKKIFYLAKQAQKQYEQTLVEAREGTSPQFQDLLGHG